MTIKRVIVWLAVLAAALVLLTAALLFWGSRSETVLRWGVDRFAQRLPCTLVIEGLRGSLLEPLNIQHMVCENARFRIEASEVALDWSPWELQQQHLQIELLRARDVRALLKDGGDGGDGGRELPSDLILPIAISVTQAQVETLIVERGDTPVTVHNLSASYRSDRQSHQLTIQRVESDWGLFDGDIEIESAAPMPVRAKVNIVGERVTGWPYTVAADITGELRELKAQLSASVRQQAFTAQADVSPFADSPVFSVSAQATQLDLAAFDSRMPSTLLQVNLSARNDRPSTISGSIEASNAKSGRIDQGLLPLAALRGHFSANNDSLQLDQMEIDLAAGGHARGSALLQRDRMTLSLDVNDLDLRALHGKLRPTALEGLISANEQQGQNVVRVDLKERKPLQIGNYRGGVALKGEGEILPDRIAITHLNVATGGASASARGHVSLDEAVTFELTGSLENFDPTRFGEFPQARINASMSVKGSVRPQWHAAVQYQFSDSTFRGTPFDSRGHLEASASRIHNTDIAIQFGGNRLNATGSFGAPGDELKFVADARNLSRIDKRLSGTLTASGTISGRAAHPAVSASLNVSNLELEQLRIKRVQASVAFTPENDPDIKIRSTLETISRGETVIDQLSVDVAGKLSRHDATLKASAPLLQLQAHLKGGWDRAHNKWTGVLAHLDNKGDYAFALLQQTDVEIGKTYFRLGASRVRFSNTDLNIGETRYANDTLVTSGSVSGIRASRLLALLDDPPVIESTLELGARWELSAGSKVDGVLEMSRSSGDVVIPGEEPLALGLNELRLRVQAKASQIHADALVRGNGIDAHATAQTRLERRGAKWGIPGSAPLKLEAVVDMQSLRPLAAAASRSITAEGKLRFTVRADGTVAKPGLTGGVDASDIKLEHVANGIFLGNGQLKAEFREAVLTVSRFTIHGGTGTLSAQGKLSSKQGSPILDLDWAADKLDIVQHPYLQLKVSGKGKLANKKQRFALTGALKADRGRIELRSGTAPTLSDDVVIVGSEDRSRLVAETRRADLDIELDLGPDFRISGRGINAQLVGQIKLTSSAEKPLAANGEIRVASGTYEAYKTQLQIDAGVLNFAGPVDNPGLSILALRKKQQVEAGVEITGTARDPRVRLYSNPDVPDPEKLSWLVLGRKIESGSSSDAQRLQGAAMAMAAGLGSLPLQKQLASAVGLDELGFRPGDAEQGGVFAVGKRISDKIYVSHEHSLSTATNTLRVSYQFSRKLSLRTESGVTDAVDLFFTVTFD